MSGNVHSEDEFSGGTLTGITVHPIKGCRRTELDSVRVAATGLEGDRQWQVTALPTDGEAVGNPITQRQNPVLATVVPQITPEGLRISADGHGTVEVSRPERNDIKVETLTHEVVECGDAGDEAAQFFSDILGEPCRLVGITPDSSRPVQLFRGREVGFADAAPVLVANTASLDDLVARAAEPFGIERFRANLIVTNDAPWSEDTWAEFSIGAAELATRTAWPRCPVPQIDQESGERHREPALVMRKHRWLTTAEGYPDRWKKFLEGNAFFGIACSIDPEGVELRIGDPVTVTATGPALLTPPAA